MIAVDKVIEIRRLLALGQLSQRNIATLTGTSRGTVGAIASGTRPEYESRPARQDECGEPLGPAVRCPGCGGKVYLPCRLCYLRQRQEQAWQARRLRRQRAREVLRRRRLLQLRRTEQGRQACDRCTAVSPVTRRLG
jgi:hypothetical protein